MRGSSQKRSVSVKELVISSMQEFSNCHQRLIDNCNFYICFQTWAGWDKKNTMLLSPNQLKPVQNTMHLSYAFSPSCYKIFCQLNWSLLIIFLRKNAFRARQL